MASAMNTTQALAQSAEAAEKMGPDLKKRSDAGMAAYKSHKILKTLVATDIKQGCEDCEQEYATGCTTMGKGLEQIEDRVDKTAEE